MVEHFELSEGLNITRILTGMWQIADLERNGTLNPDKTSEYMRPYVEVGLTSFDMADHYGSAEIIAGTFQKKDPLGNKVQLLTKWVPTPRITSKDQVRVAIHRSLERLQTECLHLLQYHAWNYLDPEWLDTMFWLQELKEEGLIANIGVTNFDAVHLQIALESGIEIVSNQISYSLLDQRAKGKMTDICQRYGIHILAFGVLAGGFLSEKWLNVPEPTEEELLTWSQMKYKRFIDAAGGWVIFQNLLRTLQTVANRYDCSISNIASRLILDQPNVAGIILGARLGVSENIQNNLQVFELQISDEDREVIYQAQSHLSLIPGGCGDEYRRPPFLTASGDLSHHLSSLPEIYEPIQDLKKIRINSGTVWEEQAGFSRAIRKGRRILVSGTTATHGDRQIGGDDPAAQTYFIIDKIQAAIESLGGTLEDVDRTRVYITNLEDWEAVALAHGNRFNGIFPANTMIQSGLIGEGYKVEIEAEATITARVEEASEPD